MKVPSEMLQYWTAGKEGTPKQYCMNVCVADAQGGNIVSDKSTMFGYRNIEVQGKDVLLNGEKIMFRAENIAFVRALNRWQNVMFDETWIRNFLRTAVQDYNFNYLRIHLGHAYSKWYEIADQEGIMLQDEWRYMHDDEPVGKDLEEVGIEFRRWIKQNVNHPSIVTWDQENEGHVRLEDLKAELRKYDPTRLWEKMTSTLNMCMTIRNKLYLLLFSNRQRIALRQYWNHAAYGPMSLDCWNHVKIIKQAGHQQVGGEYFITIAI